MSKKIQLIEGNERQERPTQRDAEKDAEKDGKKDACVLTSGLTNAACCQFF